MVIRSEGNGKMRIEESEYEFREIYCQDKGIRVHFTDGGYVFLKRQGEYFRVTDIHFGSEYNSCCCVKDAFISSGEIATHEIVE